MYQKENTTHDCIRNIKILQTNRIDNNSSIQNRNQENKSQGNNKMKELKPTEKNIKKKEITNQ